MYPSFRPGRICHLYIWREVLCDYTCGIAFAMAYDLEDAREQLNRDYEKAWLGVIVTNPNRDVYEWNTREPDEIIDAFTQIGVTLYGGG